MRPDLSALDAQLDALSSTAAPGFDVLALAQSYAGKLGPLPSIDEALAALEAGVPVVRPLLKAVEPLETARAVEPSEALPPSEVITVEEPISEQIELPEPLRDALLVEEPTGTHTLDPASSRALEFEADSDPITARHDVEPVSGGNDFKMRESGAFTVGQPKFSRREDTRDITIEPVDEELIEAEIDDMRPEAAPLANNALFDLSAPANAEAEQEADAAFAALFAEATRQSSMPSVSESDPADDTEVFHTGALSLDPGTLQETMPFPKPNTDEEIELEPGFHDETLDSAEFEIVNDVVTDARPANSPSGRPSRPPEKRPSFLGRLFGRKEE